MLTDIIPNPETTYSFSGMLDSVNKSLPCTSQYSIFRRFMTQYGRCYISSFELKVICVMIVCYV